MPTASEVVRRALRKIGVASQFEPVEASAESDGVDALNDMLHGWAAHGMSYTHATLASGDALAVPDKYIEGVVYLLAARLADDYTVAPPDPAKVAEWMQLIQAGYMTIASVTVDAGLLGLPSQYGQGQYPK